MVYTSGWGLITAIALWQFSSDYYKEYNEKLRNNNSMTEKESNP
jgi:hypothetical protein